MHKHLQLALLYMDIFYGEKDLKDLENILDENLMFNGPFFTFHSSEAYINSLIKDPPVDCSFSLIKSYVDGDSVLLLYDFQKGEIRTPISQYFLIKKGKISRIQLIFNAKDFD